MYFSFHSCKLNSIIKEYDSSSPSILCRKSTKVQTFVPTMWQNGPRPDLTLAAFPPILLISLLSNLLVGKTHIPSYRGCLANHSNSLFISFHFSKKNQIKNILTFLHFLYHINNFLLLFKKKLTTKQNFFTFL
jgi:hypothetical protein